MRREDAVQALEVVVVEAFLIDLEGWIQVVMDEADAQPGRGLEWLEHACEVLQLGFAAVAVVAVDRAGTQRRLGLGIGEVTFANRGVQPGDHNLEFGDGKRAERAVVDECRAIPCDQIIVATAALVGNLFVEIGEQPREVFPTGEAEGSPFRSRYSQSEKSRRAPARLTS